MRTGRCRRAGWLAWGAGFLVTTASLSAQALGARGGPQPNLESNLDHPLRYRPDGGDFVIENGAEFFNRPLYGRPTAFRADGGDKPEFVLYLPGRGGNLRLGLRGRTGVRWLFDAPHVTTRYRPGSLLYEIRDATMLGAGVVLRLDVIALDATDGLVVRAEATGPLAQDIELVAAYGGVNGQRGARDGDIGTERVPISEWFQLQPEFCRDNRISIDGSRFVLRSPAATIVGTVSPGARLTVADAGQWADPAALLASTGTDLPVVTARIPLTAGPPLFLALQRVADGAVSATELATYREVTADRPGVDRRATQVEFVPPYRIEDLPEVFAQAEAHFAALRRQIVVETPDPYIDAAVAALNVAADAVWDEPQGAVMHGAIAWRTRLLGWRGPYAMDALGWHERARRHLAYWATRQNTDPIPDRLPPPDENANLARSEAALHSNGDISNSHYDMNLVYIDALFRHLLWTGDLALARELWPVIERHLAWERRLFRREFTTPAGEKLPLYEAYAAIWASDDLGYHGGGVTHASAYNYWHNTMAARLAERLGHDPAPYAREAELIARGLRELLWVRETGMFAEYKDLLGRQLVHPAAALWSFYHAIDAGVPTPFEAWQMTHYVDREIPHLPVRGPGVPDDDSYHVLATSSWMPYSWSINNVVMGENNHTALGYWQAGRSEEAFRILKSALLASMYLGICPGNVGSMNYLDVYRRESQRDFADGNGVTSRAIVEGLFGLKPDALAGELRVEPGLPQAWTHARIVHPDVSVAFARSGSTDRWSIVPQGNRFRSVRVRLPARREQVMITTGAGRNVAWSADETSFGRPWITFTVPAADAAALTLTWSGGDPMAGVSPQVTIGRGPLPENPEIVSTPSGARYAQVRVGDLRWGMPVREVSDGETLDLNDEFRDEPTAAGAEIDWRTARPSATSAEPVDLRPFFNDRVTAIFQPGKYRSPRSPFVSLALPAQGLGAWAGHVNAMAEIDDSGLRRLAGENGGRFVLPNGIPFVTAGPGADPNIIFTSMWDNYPDEVTVPLHGRASRIFLLLAGSTNWMQSRFDNGEIVVAYASGSATRLKLRNPTNWWPIDQDYFIDDYQFRRPEPVPPRVNLRTGEVRLGEAAAFKGRGGDVPGGAATVLVLRVNAGGELRSLTVRALANEVVIGLMAATLQRDPD